MSGGRGRTGNLSEPAGRSASPRRPRAITAAILVGTIAAGLSSRAYPEILPAFVARHAGDALWAAMVFWILALIRPAERTRTLALTALAISVAVELSQLYQAAWIERLRATRLGAATLGHGFLWADLPRYAAGIVLAILIDLAARPLDASELEDPREAA